MDHLSPGDEDNQCEKQDFQGYFHLQEASCPGGKINCYIDRRAR